MSLRNGPGTVCSYDDGDEDVKEDPRLGNWAKWMETRGKVARFLSKSTDRPQEDLLFNVSEDARSVVEEKQVLELLKVSFPHDYYRGNPAFWKLPLHLPPRCAEEAPTYFFQPTPEQKCEIPDVEYVSVPFEVRKEKNALSKRGQLKKWNDSEYRKKRSEEMGDEILKVRDHKPELEQLCVRGTALRRETPEDVADLETELYVNPLTNHADSVANCEAVTRYAADEFLVELDGVKVFKSSPNVKIHLVFEYGVTSSKPMSKSVRFKNNTTLALRYTLRKYIKPSLFHDIVPAANPKILFFYTKRQRVVVPGEDATIEFWFQTNRHGRYTENVAIVVKPNIFDASLSVELDAIAEFEDMEARCDEIRSKLSRRCAERTAREALDAVLSAVPPPSARPVAYEYDKSAIFEAVNQEFDPITRRPKYLYDEDVVRQLEELYEKVRSRDHPKNWDYNLERLRCITKQRNHRICQNLHKTMKCAERRRVGEDDVGTRTCGCKRGDDNEKAKEDYTDDDDDVVHDVRICGCPRAHERVEVEGISRRKEGGAKNDENLDAGAGECGKEEPNENLVDQLEELISKLERPSVWTNRDRTKYTKTYAILCTQFDKICEEIEEMDERWGIARACAYPNLPERDGADGRREEVFEDVIPCHPKNASEVFGKDDKPASDVLRNMSMEDSVGRYNAYYGIEKTVEEKGKKGKAAKGKAGKAEKEKKSKKGNSKSDTKKSKQSKTKANAGAGDKTDFVDDEGIALKIRDMFDPATLLSDVPSIENHDGDDVRRIEVRDVECPIEISGQYEQNMYVIFYFNLEKAIDKISDALEDENRETLQLDVLKRALESNPNVFVPGVRPADVKRDTAPDLQRASGSFFATDSYLDSALRFESKLEKWRYEPLLEKKSGSLWSILKEVKERVELDEPVSYPKRHYRSKYRDRGEVVDVGTVMSDAGVDPNWQDFKDVAVQGEVEGDGGSTWQDVYVAGILARVLEDACKNVEGNTLKT